MRLNYFQRRKNLSHYFQTHYLVSKDHLIITQTYDAASYGPVPGRELVALLFAKSGARGRANQLERVLIQTEVSTQGLTGVPRS